MYASLLKAEIKSSKRRLSNVFRDSAVPRKVYGWWISKLEEKYVWSISRLKWEEYSYVLVSEDYLGLVHIIKPTSNVMLQRLNWMAVSFTDVLRR